MNCSTSSLLIVLGAFLSLLAVESAYAGCPKDVEVDAAIERVVEPVEVDLDRIEPGKTEKTGSKHGSVTKKIPDTVQKASVETPELGLEQLVARLKQTEAIGFFTKLAIRSDVFDFKESVETYRKREMFEENAELLRGRFNGLMLKILALLDSDPALSRDIHLARDSIWKSLVEVKS